MIGRRTLKVSFHLDEADAAWFRERLRAACRNVAPEAAPAILAHVRALVERVDASRAPPFVVESTRVLDTLVAMLEDDDYALPRRVASQALGALGYFADPQDLVPDHLPALGFLDDAIMMKLVEEEFRHEIWAYRRFHSFRAGAAQRPREGAGQGLSSRLAEERQKLRARAREQRSRARPGPLGRLLGLG